MQRSVIWLQEQSKKRDEDLRGENPNIVKFAKQHTFTTKDWTEAHSWKVSTSKQIRFLPALDVYVAVKPGLRGDLTDAKAMSYVTAFTECNWATYDEFTTMFTSVFILRVDHTRPELFTCTCAANAKEFTCCHSLGVALMKKTLFAPRAAQVQLLGRKRRRGRRPMAAPAWERIEFELRSPIQHPQQDVNILLGIPPNILGDDLAADFVDEIV